MPIYNVSDTQSIQILGVNSSASGEVTINLHPSKPTVSVNNSPYISGVADSSDSITNNKISIQVDSNNAIILDNVKTISSSKKAEVTIKLNTKLIKA